MKKIDLSDILDGAKKLDRNDLNHISGGGQLLSLDGSGGGAPCTVSCQDGHRATTTDCSHSTAVTACQGHDGPSGCAGDSSCAA